MSEIFKFERADVCVCSNCDRSVFENVVGGDAGSCHHFPPVPIMIMTQNAIGHPVPMIQPVFSQVYKSDWCAQWFSKKV